MPGASVRSRGNRLTVAPLPPVLPPNGVRHQPQIPYSTGALKARPRGFEPLTFGSVGGGSTGAATAVPTRNRLHRRISRGDTSGHERPREDAIRSHLVPTPVPTDARRGRPEGVRPRARR